MTHRVRTFLVPLLLSAVLFAAATARAASAQASSAPSVSVPASSPQTSSTQTPVPSASIPAAAAAQPLDVKAAVDAYLATVPPDKRAASNAYFEGGYWMQLWDFLIGVIVMWLFLRWRWSARMRDLAERITRFSSLQAFLYWVMFFIAVSVITFPLAVYEGFSREHKYHLSNQDFGAWLHDQAIGLGVSVILGGLLIMLLFFVVRRLGKNWWMWAAVVSVIFLAFVGLIAPVYIFPLFNKFTSLEDPKVKDPILAMARANGIPASDVYVFDASKQSDRVSANVSGMLGTTRISLNDNLLKRCTQGEIEAVMGHEMGHYVMNHQYKGLVLQGVIFVGAFAFVNWALLACLARWGDKWGIRGITDIAVIPLAGIVFSVYFFVMTPVSNTVTRTMEYEADIFGLNASGQPDGEALVDLKLGEYRKLDPSPLEEFIFFDHPSGRTRITAAMRWKAEHLPGSPLQCIIHPANAE